MPLQLPHDVPQEYQLSLELVDKWQRLSNGLSFIWFNDPENVDKPEIIDPLMNTILVQKIRREAASLNSQITTDHTELKLDKNAIEGSEIWDLSYSLTVKFSNLYKGIDFLNLTRLLLAKWIDNRLGRVIIVRTSDQTLEIKDSNSFDEVLSVLSAVYPVIPLDIHAQIEVQTGEFSEAADKKIRILFLAANPIDSDRLRLDKEIRSIEQAIRGAEYGSRFEIIQYWAVQVSDLQASLLRHKPHIVHFSGHANSSREIILENEQGHGKPVTESALTDLFGVLQDNILCVVLNACYTKTQATAIAQHIDCVVGMSGQIDDQSAITFIKAFYQALAFGRDVKTAFELGKVELNLAGLKNESIPQLLSPYRYNRNPSQTVFIRSNHKLTSASEYHLPIMETLVSKFANADVKLDDYYYHHFISPIWDTYKRVHEDYKDSFRRYLSLLSSDTPQLSNIASEIRLDSIYSRDIRTELEHLVIQLPVIKSKNNEIYLWKFIKAISDYFAAANTLSVNISQWSNFQEKIVFDRSYSPYDYEQRPGLALINPRTNLAAYFSEGIVNIEEAKNIFDLVIKDLQIGFSRTSEAYYSLRAELLFRA